MVLGFFVAIIRRQDELKRAMKPETSDNITEKTSQTVES
jgi:hypothetical protein